MTSPPSILSGCVAVTVELTQTHDIHDRDRFMLLMEGIHFRRFRWHQTKRASTAGQNK